MAIHTGSLAVLLAAAVLWAGGANAASEDQPADSIEQRIEQARKQLDEAARRLGELHQELWRLDRGSTVSDRPMLGILVDDRGGPDGLEVVGVTPEGGAERAGIRAGDRLVAVNGVALDGDAERPPLARLGDALGSAAVGEAVTVTFVRDGQRIDTEIVTQPHRRFMADLLHERLAPLRDVDARGHLEALAQLDFSEVLESLKGLGLESSRLALRGVARVPAGLELRDIGPVLGRYFGVDGGVLVLETPDADADAGLQPGDVLLALDGEPVADAGRALRTLGEATGELEATVRRNGRERRVALDAASLNARQDLQLDGGSRRIVILRGRDARERGDVDD
jgi:S1-C subfamily serine protease